MAEFSLNEAFFNIPEIINYGADSLLMGLASQKSQAFDPFLVDQVRNFLFGAASGGNDLASVNIARGRDVGLGSLNQVRTDLGLTPYDSFTAINSDPTISNRLGRIYLSVDDVDLWLGGLAEKPYQNGAILGETFKTIVVDQFTRLRDGDRFFYLNDLDTLTLLEPNLEDTNLAELIARNSTITGMQSDAFSYTQRDIPESSTVFPLMGLGILFLIRNIAQGKREN
jgi:peroxidase